MTRPEKIRLGDLLIQQKLITGDQLQSALDEQKRNGRKLGRVLVDNGFITEEQISESLAKQLDIPYINLKNHTLNLELARRLPESQARRFRALVLEERNGMLLIGMADPTDLAAFDELGHALNRIIDLAVVTEGQLLETIERVYRRTEELSGLTRETHEELNEHVVNFGAATDNVGAEEMPVVNLLEALFSDALQDKASSIHIDLQEGSMHISFRIDGRLQLQAEADKKIAPALMHRLKLMSGLDTSEKHMPQDGHFNVYVRRRAVDVLISTMPTQHGESVAMRLPKQDDPMLSLDKLDMPSEMLARFREIVRRGNGMVLVTDPADSGNIATLYAVLAEIKTAGQKIITVEDPIEYSLPGIAQVQVDEKAGLNFSQAVRSALRQDPDVILVGEMRDKETAQISLRAAMDGRLVFSTLHARDAADALFFLADMGVAKYLVASSLQVVLAQRSLRRVCASCSEPYTPSGQEAAWLKHAGLPPERQGELRRGRGCAHCNDTGFNDRIAVYEMLEIDGSLRQAAEHSDAARFMQIANAQMKGHTLLDHALAQLTQGYTTVAEVMRIGNRAEG